jgi:hypothetical protein
MGGIAILLIVALYLVAAIFVVRAVKGQRARIAATIVVILIPTADAILGRLYLKYLCETQGGAKVYRVVENVEGFRWHGAIVTHDSDENRKRFLDLYGLPSIESAIKKDGTVDRISLRDGKLTREQGVSPIAKYQSRFLSSDYGIAYVKNQFLVETTDTNEVIGTHTQFIFDGGWAEQLLSSFSDAGPGSASWCRMPAPEERLRILIVDSLKSTPSKGR